MLQWSGKFGSSPLCYPVDADIMGLEQHAMHPRVDHWPLRSWHLSQGIPSWGDGRMRRVLVWLDLARGRVLTRYKSSLPPSPNSHPFCRPDSFSTDDGVDDTAVPQEPTDRSMCARPSPKRDARFGPGPGPLLSNAQARLGRVLAQTTFNFLPTSLAA